jgi:hypothetical protein
MYFHLQIHIIFSLPHIISEFIRLEILILDNIHTKNLHEIFLESMCLPNLHSMVLHPGVSTHVYQRKKRKGKEKEKEKEHMCMNGGKRRPSWDSNPHLLLSGQMS